MYISDALELQPITSSRKKVESAIEGFTYQGGFTNLAQALVKAGVMLSKKGSRAYAASAVVVITDGKFSFRYQTEQVVTKLKDKGHMIFMVPVTEDKAECNTDNSKSDFFKYSGPDGTQAAHLCQLRSWASEPWWQNYEQIPGIVPLASNTHWFVQRVIIKICPQTASHLANFHHEGLSGYLELAHHKFPDAKCASKAELVPDISSLNSCRDAAKLIGYLGFSWDSGDEKEGRAARCFADNIQFTLDNYLEWSRDAGDNAPYDCPGGGWEKGIHNIIQDPTQYNEDSSFFNTFAIAPMGADERRHDILGNVVD